MREIPVGFVRRRRWLGASFAIAIAFAVSAATAAAAPRIVAVGDVHGDLAAFKGILVEAGVLDARGAWVGRDAQLVQLGDLIDRGPSLRGVLDFVMALERSAGRGGGRVVTLLGNHEVMNLTGDLRYVNPATYAEFADGDSERRRAEAWRKVTQLQKRRALELGQAEPPSGPEAEQAWLDAHPAGFLEYREAFGPRGKYGRWLRGRPAQLVAQGTAFLHGGLAPALAGASLAEIEQRVHEDLATLDSYRQLFVAQGLILPFYDLKETSQAVFGELQALAAAETAAREAAEQAGKTYTTPAKDAERRRVYERYLDWGTWTINAADGPLWFRGFSQWSDAEGDAQMPRLLQAAGVKRFVVGHTIQEGSRIRARFGAAVILIDTGMLASYFPGGRASALEIAGDKLSAIYPGEGHQVIEPPPAKAVADTTPAPTPASPAVPTPVPTPAPTPVPTSTAALSPRSAPVERVFLDPDGKPLPFQNDEELLEFLREAKVVEVKPLGEGITHVRRLTLERSGVRAHAVFRHVRTGERNVTLPGGRRELFFRDFYGFEPAAYRLGRLLGVDNIPPATLRVVDRESGSVQAWIEKAMTEERRRAAKSEPPDGLRWNRQKQMMQVWDVLAGNNDRNQGNYLYTPSWSLWLIDHTRCFRSGTDLLDAQRIVWCERGFWDKMRTVADAEIIASVKEGLEPREITGLLERRKKLVALIEGLIRERGEAAVLFSWAR